MARPSIVTSVKVDEGLWKRAKKRAIDDEITLQELFNRAVEDWLKRENSDSKRRKREN